MGVGEEDDQQSQQHQQSRHLKVLESFKYTQNLIFVFVFIDVQRQQSRHLKVKCCKVLNMHRILSLSLSLLTNSASKLHI